MTETEIFKGAAAGDAGALREWVALGLPRVRAVCELLLGGDEALPEAVAGTFRRALGELKDGAQPEGELPVWWALQAGRECYAVLRGLRRAYDAQTQGLENLAASIPTLVEITPDATERVNFMIRGDLEDLPKAHSEVLAMSELEGLPWGTLAKRLGCSWAEAVRRLTAARGALADKVRGNFGL